MRFVRRVGLSMRRRTHIAQKLPAELDSTVLNFHRRCITARKEHGYDLSLIFNKDQTSITLDAVRTASRQPHGWQPAAHHAMIQQEGKEFF